jgi:hypothetical protein
MKMMFASSLAALALAASVPAFAEPLELPRPSPSGKITQTAGITDISVEFSSPAVRGRPVWGSVVPFGEVWRAGANMATKVTFSKDVTIGSTAVPAGSYAYFVIPNKGGPWTVIINKDFNQGGAFNYKKDLDVVRVDVTPATIPNRERLTYIVSNFNEEAATLDLEWEKVRLSLPIKLNTDAQVAANIKAVEDNAWEPYNASANYELQLKKDYDAGLVLADKSLHLKETWQNLWTKAQLLNAKGRGKDAYAFAQKAQMAGKTAPKYFQDGVSKALTEWKR